MAVTSHIGKKLVEGELGAEVTHVKILGHMSVIPNMSSHMRPFLFGCHISFC